MKLSDFDDCGHVNFHDFGRCLYKNTDCGPYVVAVLQNGTHLNYQSMRAQFLSMETPVQGVEVGSIVEGSDAEIGPYLVTDPTEFARVVEQVNQEAKEAWDAANEGEEVATPQLFTREQIEQALSEVLGGPFATMDERKYINAVVERLTGETP